LNGLFNRVVAAPRIRHGFKQTLDTLISEETTLLGKYRMSEKGTLVSEKPNGD